MGSLIVKPLVVAALAVALLTPAGVLLAHARFDPNKLLKPRTNSTGEKSGPCGPVGPTTLASKRKVLQAGADLLVEWQETINHPGHFRIAFSPDGVTGFDDHIIADNIVDTQNTSVSGTNYHLYSKTIKVPDTLCDTCSLQLIQVMTENPASPSNYYSCADIRIVADLTQEPPTPSVSPTTSPGATTPAASDPEAPATPTGLKVQARRLKATEAADASK